MTTREICERLRAISESAILNAKDLKRKRNESGSGVVLYLAREIRNLTIDISIPKRRRRTNDHT